MTHGSSLAPPPRWPIQAYNALARAGVRLGCRPAPIRVRDVLRTARRSTGLADLGEQRIAEPLARLTRGYDMEAGLSPFGRRVARGILESLLAERLRIVDVLTRHPEIREIPIRQPMFVVGFPRTGTTLLYNLLAQSAGARALLTWESVYPAPPPGGRATRRDPRARRVSWQIRLIKYLVPEFDTIHELDAMAPEEDMRLLRHTFVSWAFALPGDMPGYIEWLMQVEPETVREAYRFYRNQLQLLSWRHEPARWLLKSPAHMPFLDRLLDVFDDACVVQTHRDPAQVLGSSCSLAAAASRPLVNRLDLHQVGASVLVRAEQAMSRLERMRDRIEPGRVCDVRYDDLVADPVGTVRRIHAHFDLDLPADMADRMRRWLADHPRHKHGRHRYSLEQFGLDRHEVDAVFAPYVRRFGLRGDVSASTVSDRPVPLEAPAPRPGP